MIGRVPGAVLRRLLVLRWPRAAAVAFCGVAGTLLPAAFAMIAGVADPANHDEFAYLLGADTFAQGRLANPPPALPEFFEAPHVLVAPTYGSKYPPGQSLLLAAGQVIAGHPVWGVWLGCGLFAASLCWMLQAWSSRQWALAVTVLMMVTLGTSTYWAQSYWGGMLAASGAALVFGGMRRILHAPRVVVPGVLLGLGVAILAITRPFEGLLVCIPAAVLLGRWCHRDGPVSRAAKLKLCIVSVGCVLLGGVGLTAVHNRAVTGSWHRTPHGLHLQQYFYQGLFLFSGPQEPDRTPAERVTAFYRSADAAPTRTRGVAAEAAGNLLPRLGSTVVFALGLWGEPREERHPYRGFLLWLPLLVACAWYRAPRLFSVLALAAVLVDSLLWWHVPTYPVLLKLLMPVLWLAAFLATRRTNRWAPFIALTLLLVAAGQSLVWWWFPHYAAPLVPLVFAGIATSMQRMSRRLRSSSAARLVPALAVLFLIHGAVLSMFHGSALRPGAGHRARHALQPRADLVRTLRLQGGSHLVFVRYANDVSVHAEWVYNAADLTAARVIFAHDLGEARNPELIAAYPGRSVWLVTVTLGAAGVEPYPIPFDDGTSPASSGGEADARKISLRSGASIRPAACALLAQGTHGGLT